MSGATEENFHDDLVSSKEDWAAPVAGPSMASRLVAEAAGAFVLFTFGLGAAIWALPFNSGQTWAVGLGFGTALLVLIVALGRISGAHFNPAVTVGLWAAGRFPARDIAPYVLAQVLGGVAAGGVLRLVLGASPAAPNGADGMDGLSIGWGDHSPWGVGLAGAIAAEALFTGALVATILAATSVKAPAHQAPFTIAITLAVLVVCAIPFTNGALNPARATATAVWSHGWALGQLWAWWVAPALGGLVAGLGFRAFGAPEDIEAAQASEGA